MEKRRLTNTLFSLSAKDESDQRPGISPDLVARLRNLGPRVRKHVSEGYATNNIRASSTPPSPMQLPLDTDIFRSANDTLHLVRSAWPSGSHPERSPRKRGRAEFDLPAEDTHLGMDIDDDDEPVTFILRPTKPLRRSRRAFTATQSLPVDAFSFSDSSPLYTPDSLDDDWGANAFPHFTLAS